MMSLPLSRARLLLFTSFSLLAPLAHVTHAQDVCLPAPRLLTLMPMGARAGSSVEVRITGESLENVTALLFSNPKITAQPVIDANGAVVENRFRVEIPADAEPGIVDGRVMTRLGLSSSRAFSIGTLPEITREKPSHTVETACELAVNSICNATMTKRAVDHYTFHASQGQRIAVDCAAAGIDSKLTPVLIIADAQGRDLVVNRTGGVLEFTAPAEGSYMVKVHGLTFQGGPEHFYRLAIREIAGDEQATRQPMTASVSAMSWPPVGLAAAAKDMEHEPNNTHSEARKVTLPCDIAGSFFPAADVDTYEFEAKKDEVWWVEVASERLGLPTDPFVLVQRVGGTAAAETLVDVAELYDIASPLKVSTNGYSYDGPPYDAGSPDVLGKVEIKEDGVHRLQIRDLFGGTRSDRRNSYRLIVRQAAPDFSLAAWAVHMTLRNGDRAALSKPIALRAGGSMALEVVAIRRDGFDGEIELAMEGLPPGVRASGLKIAKGKSVGTIVVTASADAKTAHGVAKILGRGLVNGETIERQCRLASMKWPVRDAKSEIPSPRLLADVPVSVTESEHAPMTVAASEDRVWEAKVGETLKIPLNIDWRNEFTGTSVKWKTYGAGFEAMKEWEIPVKATSAEAVLDLAALKVPPGEYTIAFYGSAVSRYRYNPEAVSIAEAARKKAEDEATAVAAAAKKLAEEAAQVPTDKKSDAANAAKIAAEKQKQAETAMAAATKHMKTVSDAASPKDTVDIIISEPIRISVKAVEPSEVKTAATPR